MKREIGLALVYRDMWQSACRYFPNTRRLNEVAPAIVGMGCFDRVETNGGAFEQVCLMSGENPNKAVREWTAHFRDAGIRTQMLERGLCALALSPVPADVRELLYKVKKSQGVDISRSFCGLNDPDNLQFSIVYAKKAGMTSQAALAMADSPVHTLEHYMSVVDKVVEYGCDEICLKDMSGTVQSSFIAELTSRIRRRHPDLYIQYHGHCGRTASSTLSVVDAVRAGADCVDVAIEPLAWGKGHPDVLAVIKALKAEGFCVKEVDMDAYMTVSELNARFLADYGCDDTVASQMNRTLADSIIPGGMVGSVLPELQDCLNAVNSYLRTVGDEELTFDRFMALVLDEVEYIWPALGYPPMVTPFSQYVKNTALMNVMNLLKGKPRWTTIDKDTWNMILGRMGRLPGNLAPEIIALAKERGKEFYDGVPQDALADGLDRYRAIMCAEGWDSGQDDEELLQLAMHERQYRAYKRGMSL